MNTVLAGYLCALTAGASYGLAQVLTRFGVTEYTTPLAGGTISLLAGSLGVGLLTSRDLASAFRRTDLRRGLLLFSLAGIAGSAGVLINYIALSVAPIVVVAPVLGVNPLVTLVCAALFLRGMERITRRIVMGSVLVVIGVLCITLSTALHL